ncbi:flagellar biosynthesis protein FliQ [Litorivicinus sp.]|nr:flagellar biosynthesis protein FliQ [Litorivicinus sp.]MDB9862097.1 flagellar biosynthesis protein FliQ [Litorivicinus sp.]MDC1208254.1 flagellar biosynthesis protein FliQ [Litorivicinus sp.]MDC1240515.1 flagellar biosynthesis protein FliQ [Litorivicinus sp.]MDC1466111.1 flagellar biosynthesis protein FliQ [Litorivicinus sp.]
MDPAMVIELGRESLLVAVIVAAPMLGMALAVGLFIGVIQAATSINEMTLSFIPKLGALVLVMIFIGGWQISVVVEFMRKMYERIPTIFF